MLNDMHKLHLLPWRAVALAVSDAPSALCCWTAAAFAATQSRWTKPPVPRRQPHPVLTSCRPRSPSPRQIQQLAPLGQSPIPTARQLEQVLVAAAGFLSWLLLKLRRGFRAWHW